jgi:ADP-heptose:LPS heptosyltransferase
MRGRRRTERFDLALLLPNSLHVALMAWLGGARQRVGYARDAYEAALRTRMLISAMMHLSV